MQLEIGSTYQGKVKRITNYGAFIAIQPDAAAPETVTGMVHISEISNRFVHDIHEFVQEGQEVQVKVIGMQDNKNQLVHEADRTAAATTAYQKSEWRCPACSLPAASTSPGSGSSECLAAAKAQAADV